MNTERKFAGLLTYHSGNAPSTTSSSPVIITSSDDIFDYAKSDNFGVFIHQAIEDDENWAWLLNKEQDYTYKLEVFKEFKDQNDLDLYKSGNPLEIEF